MMWVQRLSGSNPVPLIAVPSPQNIYSTTPRVGGDSLHRRRAPFSFRTFNNDSASPALVPLPQLLLPVKHFHRKLVERCSSCIPFALDNTVPKKIYQGWNPVKIAAIQGMICSLIPPQCLKCDLKMDSHHLLC